MPSEKTYNSTNFFKHTFCEFQQIDDFQFPDNSSYKSKSKSKYHYTEKGVYRKSNHWGRVANCRWKLITDKTYKNQQEVIGFAKWTDFYPLNSNKKIFFIQVDFKLKKAKIQANRKNASNFLYDFSEAQKRVKKINHLLKEDKWSKHFNQDLEILRKGIITKYINSDKDLQSIKSEFKS